MLSIILLDEMPDHNSMMQQLLQETVDALGETAAYYTAETLGEVISIGAKAYPRSIYLLDIELEGGDSYGIDAAYKIHEADPNGYIVYVSAHQQYAIECLHSHAFDFLSKPVSSVELTACLKAILADMERAPAAPAKKFWIASNGVDISVNEKDIAVIRCRGNFCEMTVDGQFYRWKESLRSVESRLDSTDFLKISRQFILNLRQVRVANWPYSRLTLASGEEVAFSRSAAKVLKQRLSLAGEDAP